MAERETKTITTPVDGKVLVIKTYVTGREMRAIENIFVTGADIDPVTQQAKHAITGETADQAQDKLIETVVVSVDGSAENVVNTILDFKKPDYDFVIKEIQAVSRGSEFADKKKA